MKKLLILFVLPMILLCYSSCKKINGKGDIVTEIRGFTGFTAIQISLEADLHFTPDTIYSVKISAQQNILDIIETTMEGGTLIFKVKEHYVIGRHDPITIYITAPNVNLLDISGSGNIYQSGTWNGDNLRTNISGSGSIVLDLLETPELSVSISGSGSSVGLGGAASKETLNISGSGNIDLVEVAADTVYAAISGSGDIKVSVGKYLEATISGSGNVLYQGNPVIVTHITGSGTVRPL
jgi:hypothetical protein